MPNQSSEDGNTIQQNFLSMLAQGCPEGLNFLVSLKTGERFGTWTWDGKPLKPGPWYFYTGASDHRKLRRDENTKAVRAIVIDDVGTKVEASRIKAPPTWILETSKGNFQYGFLLQEWTTDIEGADALFTGLVAAGLQDKGVVKSCRLFRIPGSINDKKGREAFVSTLVHFDKDAIYTLENLAQALDVKPGERKPRRERPEVPPAAGEPDPIFDWLYAKGMVVERKNAAGWWHIECPWHGEHTDGRTTAKYMCRGDSDSGRGVVWCEHSHGQGDQRALYTQKFFDWVVANGGPENKPYTTAISDADREMLAAICRGAADFKEDPPPRATVPTLEHDVDDPNLYDFITLRAAIGPIDITKLPNIEMGKDGPKAIQPTSYENVQAGLRQLGVHPRLNLMTARTSYILPERIDMSRFGNKTEYEIAEMVRCVLTDVFGRARMKNKKDLEDCFAQIANSIYWHPMRDWVLSRKWDGKDRLEMLAGTVPTAAPDLWKRYLRRWLLQGIEASCGWTIRRKSQKGMVLVLVGPQRIGKSRWLMSLAPDFGTMSKHLNLNGHGARDSKHEALQGVVVELGELDATFNRTDIAALKAFITEETDEYRLPYAAVWLRRPRCTSFCGSVNDRRFLNDPTGSGRFLAVEVTGRPQVDHGIDMQQVWAQVYEAWAAGEQWYLTEDEERMRDGQANHFQVSDPIAETIMESLDQRKDTDRYPVQVIVGSMHMLVLCELDKTLPKNLRSAGIALEKVLGRPRNLYRRGAPTKESSRWIVQATSQEVRQFKLYVAKPESVDE